jgi:hypothetical protein
MKSTMMKNCNWMMRSCYTRMMTKRMNTNWMMRSCYNLMKRKKRMNTNWMMRSCYNLMKRKKSCNLKMKMNYSSMIGVHDVDHSSCAFASDVCCSYEKMIETKMNNWMIATWTKMNNLTIVSEIDEIEIFHAWIRCCSLSVIGDDDVCES